jgi:protein-tyrosine phosphatase
MSDVDVRSSGTSARSGSGPSEGALRAAERHGLPLETHTSSSLSSDLVAWADIVLVMGPSHLHRVRELGGARKGHLLMAFAEEKEGEELGGEDLAIPDPFGGDDSVYEGTYQALKRFVGKAMERLGKEARA